MQAESNRNPERRSEPFSLYDFTFWGEITEKATPSGAAGAAMLRLIQLNLFPSYALDGPWIADLETQGKDAEVPARLCWAADDAILLAPYRVDTSHWCGFLIAQRSAVGNVKEFFSEKGESTKLLVPSDVVPSSAFASAKASVNMQIVFREN